MSNDNMTRWIDHLDIALEQMDNDTIEAEFVEDVMREMVDEQFEEANS